MSRLVLLSVLMLAACDSSDPGEAQTPVTQGEVEALDDAASMLDERRLPDQEAELEDTQGETE